MTHDLEGTLLTSLVAHSTRTIRVFRFILGCAHEFTRRQRSVRDHRHGLLGILIARSMFFPQSNANAIDFQTEALEGSILWGGSVVSGHAASAISVEVDYLKSSARVKLRLMAPTASMLFLPGTRAVGIYGNGCGGYGPDNRMGDGEVDVVAEQTTNTDFDITETAGRLTGTISVNGAPLADPYFSIPNECAYWSGESDGTFLNYMPPRRLHSRCPRAQELQPTRPLRLRDPGWPDHRRRLRHNASRRRRHDRNQWRTWRSWGRRGHILSEVTTGGNTIVVESGCGRHLRPGTRSSTWQVSHATSTLTPPRPTTGRSRCASPTTLPK